MNFSYGPVYNILYKAENSLGFTHTEEPFEKMKKKALGRTHSLEVRKRMSENRKGSNNSFCSSLSPHPPSFGSLSYAKLKERVRRPEERKEIN